MDRALWLLLWLRFIGWFRRLGRGTRSVRGVLLLVVGLLFFACVFLNPVIAYLVGPVQPGEDNTLEHMRRFGPVGLFAYCAMNLVFSTGERAISFSPAEVNFLFSGPFSRRQLLGYKLASSAFGCLVTALFVTAVTLPHGVWLPAAYLGLVLTFLFLYLFGMVIGLAVNALGARAYNRRRRLVLAGLALLVLAGLLPLGRELPHLGPRELLDFVEHSPVVQTLLAPLGWFVRAVTAQTPGELLVYGAGGLAVNAVLVALVFVLDADYLEASAAASEKVYARIQRIRRGGASAGWYTPGNAGRLSVPSLPWWGGVGPIAWRQLTSAVRSLRGLTIFLAILGGALLVVPVVVMVGADRSEQPAVRLILAITLGVLSLISLPATLTFDFRGDVDRIDVLKTLPIAPWRIVLGQLAASVLLLGLIQLAGLAGIQAVWGGMETVLLGAALLCWPANFLTLGVDNLLFLWFPTRQVVATPGDFQMMGRQMVLMLAKFLALGIAFGVAVLVGLPVGFLTQSVPAGVAAAFVVLAGFAGGLVPLLALAFENFDVARDTPP
jgi:Putative ABC exporter